MDTTAIATQPPKPTATTPLLPKLDKLASLSSTTNATSLNEPITPPLPLTNLPPQHTHFFSSYIRKLFARSQTYYALLEESEKQGIYLNNIIFQ
jgi:hypothetical protein